MGLRMERGSLELAGVWFQDYEEDYFAVSNKKFHLLKPKRCPEGFGQNNVPGTWYGMILFCPEV